MLPKTTDDGGGNSGADHGPRRPRQSSTVRTVSLGVVAVVASVLSSPPASNIPHLPDELQRTVEDDTCSTALQNLSPSLAPLLARHSFSILSILHNLNIQMYGYLVTRVSQRNNLFFGVATTSPNPASHQIASAAQWRCDDGEDHRDRNKKANQSPNSRVEDSPLIVRTLELLATTTMVASPLRLSDDAPTMATHRKNTSAGHADEGVRGGSRGAGASGSTRITTTSSSTANKELGSAVSTAAPTTPRGRSAARRLRSSSSSTTPLLYDDQYHTAYRTRSLSTGRSRPRSGHDLVQDVYDRMGVNYKWGEASPVVMVLPATAPSLLSAPPPLPAATSTAGGGSLTATTADRAMTLVDDGEEEEAATGTAGPRTPRESSSAALATKIYTANGSTVSSPLREKFQKLYFRNTAGGTGSPFLLQSTRGREMERLGLHDPASSERRRSRSLTRIVSSAPTTLRTNPPHTTTTNTDTLTTKTTSTPTATVPSPATAASGPALPSLVAATASASTSAAPRWSPYHGEPALASSSSHSSHRLAAQSHPVAVAGRPYTGSPMLSETKKKQHKALELEAATSAAGAAEVPASGAAGSVTDASRDESTAEAVVLPSVKDRLALFGGNGKVPPPKKGSAANRRMLAATRDYPPKIDIYGLQQQSQTVPDAFDGEDEKKDDGDYPLLSSSNTTEQLQTAHLPAKVLDYSSKESSGGGSRVSSNSNIHHGYLPNAFRSVPTIPVSPEPTRFKAPTSARQPPSRQPQLQPVRPLIGLKVAPVIEVPVVAEPDGPCGLGGATDNCSLVSSLGADETAVGHKPSPIKRLPSWQVAPSSAPPVAGPDRHRGSAYEGTTTAPIPHTVTGGPAGGAGASEPPTPVPVVRPTTLTNDWIERVVEERLQAHLAVLEVRTETELQRRTRDMEERLTAKLQSLEDKLVALTAAAALAPVAVVAGPPTTAVAAESGTASSVRSAPPQRFSAATTNTLGAYSGW